MTKDFADSLESLKRDGLAYVVIEGIANMLQAAVVEHSTKERKKWRKVCDDRPPYHIEPDGVVIVNQNMPHAFHQSPWDLRMCIASGGGNMAASLSHDQKIADYRVDRSLVVSKLIDRNP